MPRSVYTGCSVLEGPATTLLTVSGTVQESYYCMYTCIDAGNTALHYAAMSGSTAAFYCLLCHGADAGITNNDKATALDTAKKYGKYKQMSKAGNVKTLRRKLPPSG